MAEPDEEFSGMGGAPRGPSFMPSQPRADPGLLRPSVTSYRPESVGPTRSLRPTVISILAMTVVAAVVGAASLVAYRGDTHVTAPPRAVVAPLPSSAPPDRVDFVTPDGSGQLIMRTRSWLREGRIPPASGYYLRLEVELLCTAGEVDYDPYLFQAFDETGKLYEMAAAGTGSSVLPVGLLTEGQRIRGVIAFDMPRGNAMLMMSDDSDKAVTALRVPD